MTDARAPILNLSPCFPGPNKILVRVVAIVPGWLETECGIYHICEKNLPAERLPRPATSYFLALSSHFGIGRTFASA